MELETHSQPRCLQKIALQLEKVLWCPIALIAVLHCSIEVSACFCDPRCHCLCSSVEEKFIFCKDEAQVGPGALKWRVTQLFDALCELCPVNPAQAVLWHLFWLPTRQVTLSRAG